MNTQHAWVGRPKGNTQAGTLGASHAPLTDQPTIKYVNDVAATCVRPSDLSTRRSVKG